MEVHVMEPEAKVCEAFKAIDVLMAKLQRLYLANNEFEAAPYMGRQLVLAIPSLRVCDVSSNYGDPKDGCMSDETEITIQGVTGDFCTPKCSLFKACPTDVPAGVTVAPQCALQDSSTGDKYCALICSPTLPILDQKAADAQCGDNASCKSVQLGVGVCTYDD